MKLRTLELEELERILASALVLRSREVTSKLSPCDAGLEFSRKHAWPGLSCITSGISPARLPRMDFDSLARSLGIAICDSEHSRALTTAR